MVVTGMEGTILRVDDVDDVSLGIITCAVTTIDP